MTLHDTGCIACPFYPCTAATRPNLVDTWNTVAFCGCAATEDGPILPVRETKTGHHHQHGCIGRIISTYWERKPLLRRIGSVMAKAIPVQSWTGTEVSRMLGLSDIKRVDT
jgi:hypothetical protein